MSGLEQATRLWSSLRSFGARRLIAMGVVLVTVLLAVTFGAYYLSQPERVPLYTGLSRDDVGRIGGALKDAGISFDVSSDGTAVLVGHSDTVRARMLLAEKGLPQSASSGYELFNEVGSFGLTSFMQDVTRTRALEGELARTIQAMDGVKAARVHIVLPERGSFRSEQQPASASIVIRTDNADDMRSAQAIRHLVASAVPGMKLENVTLLNTEGTVLASGDNGANASGGLMAMLEQQVSSELEEKIRRTLAPYLGIGNFQVSVATELNTDQTKTSETIFDPASRVERSVRVVKENALAQNSSAAPPASVQEGIPEQALASDSGKNSNEENQRREETTNFEISSKTIETAHDGYAIHKLSIAVMVNRDKLKALGGEGTDDATPPETQLMEIEQLVSSAAGLDKDRGDQMKVAAVTFLDGGKEMEPVPGPGIVEIVVRQIGTIINAGTILVVAILLIWFGLKPAVKVILARPDSKPSEVAAIAGPGQAVAALPPGPSGAIAPPEPQVSLIGDLTSKINRQPQKRLEQIIEFDEGQAAAVLKQWLGQEARA